MDPVKKKEALRKRIAHACAVRFNGSVPVFGEGPLPCRLMVIGEAPGRDETRLGKPFVGKGGSFFVGVLEEALGLKRDEIYITNVLNIWPNVETRRRRTRPPESDEAGFFIPFLLEEISIVDPAVIITAGKTAFSALFPGKPFRPGEWAEFDGRAVMPVYHPSYLLRRQKRLKESVAELKDSLKSVKKKLGS
ncbi:MAG: uracil-DNA glycosylase [Deltaproteobacteria bacterium]|nr:uracil-DNA glycosylase [Deltaproteobacteria bacterium]MBZ0219922.1 uracil-DNA glycosylase [Deltaproteobacteria bacterium]